MAGQPVPAATAGSQAALLKADDALFAADIHHDVGPIERGFVGEAVFVDANGMSQTKADYIAATRAAKFPITAIRAEGGVVRIFGDVGVVRGVEPYGGRHMHLAGSYLSVYVLRDGRWQLLDQQSAPEFKPRSGG